MFQRTSERKRCLLVAAICLDTLEQCWEEFRRLVVYLLISIMTHENVDILCQCRLSALYTASFSIYNFLHSVPKILLPQFIDFFECIYREHIIY